MKEITLYFTEINNVTTKINAVLPNNLNFILDEVRYKLREYPIYIYCRFYFAGSYYQINNKNYKQL